MLLPLSYKYNLYYLLQGQSSMKNGKLGPDNLITRNGQSIVKSSKTNSAQLNVVKRSANYIESQKSFEQLMKEIKILEEKQQNLIAQNNKNKKITKDKEEEVNKLEDKIVQLKKQISKAEKQVNQKNEELSQQNIQCDLVSKELAEVKAKTLKLQQENYKVIRNTKDAERKFEEMKGVLQGLQKEKEDLERNVEQVRKEKQDIEKRLESLLAATDISDLKLKLQEEKQILAKEQLEVRQLNNKVAIADKQYKQKLNILSQQQTYIKNLQLERDAIKQQIKLNVPQRRQSQVLRKQLGHLFAGDILASQLDYKSYLLSILEKKTNAKIIKTRLVYRWDPLNSNNFHKYIDGRQNLVVIIKLVNGLVLGAWSEGSLIPKTPSTGQGLIFSLTHRQYFQLLEPNKKATVYDEFFLIFGNSELRMRTQSKTVFSNFGVNNSFYKHRDQGVEVLFGQKGREAQMENYQIFQIKLK